MHIKTHSIPTTQAHTYLRLSGLAVALTAASLGGCAMAEPDQAPEISTRTSDLSAFVLNVNSGENPITISSPGTADNVCPAFETRNFAYISGAQLSIRTFQTNTPDCEQFIRWDGACAGQGHQCSIVINSELSTTSVFGPIRGCVPK